MSEYWIARMIEHLFFILGGLAVVFHLYHALRRWPQIGWIALGGFIAVASDFPYLPPLMTVGSISIRPEDTLTVVLAVDLVVFRLASLRAETRGTGFKWMGFLALLAVSLAGGVSSFGLGTSVNEAREFLELIVALAWALSQISDPAFEKRLTQFAQMLGWVLVAVALYHVALRGLGSADVQILQDNEYVTDRPLVAGQALTLSLLAYYGIARRKHVVSSLVFLAVAMVCQHRSVWVATAAGLIVLALLGSSNARSRIFKLALLGGAALVLLWGFGGLGDLPAKISYDLQSRGTLNGRTEDFATLIGAQNRLGLSAVLHGQPFGTGFARINTSGQIETYAPHDWYVLMYLRVGLLGAGLMAWMMAQRLVQHVRRRNDLQSCWMVVIGVFALAYHLPWYIGPFLGIAMARSEFGGQRHDAAIDAVAVREASRLVAQVS